MSNHQVIAGFSAIQKRAINSFVAEMKKANIRFVKSDILINKGATYVRLTVKSKSNSWVHEDVYGALKDTFQGAEYKYSKYRVGGILPYMHWELQNSHPDAPQTVVFDADWNTMYIQF